MSLASTLPPASMERSLAEDNAGATSSSCGRKLAEVDAREDMYVEDSSFSNLKC